MSRPSLRALALGLVALAPATLAADTLQVPAEFPTIQAALDAASAGDTVLVADGVYKGPGNRDLNPLGKDLVIRSVNGPTRTTIDAEGTSTEPYRGFVFENGETRATVLEGFTITGGATLPGAVNDQFNGGAVIIRSSSPTIRDCHFVANSSGCWGGAVYSGDTGESGLPATPVIENCLFEGNYTDDDGGGFFTWSFQQTTERTIIRNSVFINNGAAVTGGAITDFGSNGLLIENVTVVGNAALFGSGLNVGNAIIRNSIFWGNGGDDLQLWGSANLAHCNVQGGIVPGPGNVSVQPSFAADGYHLRPGSPMVDAGVRVTNGATEDIDGQARVFGRAPDIGADELRWHEAEVSMP